MTELSDKIQSYVGSLFGKENLNKFIEYINSSPSQFIRVNSLKTTPEKIIKVLSNKYGIKTERVPGLQNTLKVIKGNELAGKTIEHILGFYYIQGLSSMLPALVLSPYKDDIVLDLCAAPGSKTTQLAELMNNKGILIANEIQLSRLKALVHNIERLNIINTGVIHQKGELLSKIYSDYFDKILVDAPCSGLGIIQKKGEVIQWWNEEKVTVLAGLQLKLLIAAIKMLKMGGEVVYSTCTMTAEENESIISKVLSKYPVELIDVTLPILSGKGLISSASENFRPELQKSKRIFPWETGSDGFFIAKLRKTGLTTNPEQIIPQKRNIKLLNHKHKDINERLNYIRDYFGVEENILAGYNYLIKNKDIYFVPLDWYDNNPGIFERIGTKFGSLDKSGEITLHTQAAQVLGKSINKAIIEINNMDELKTYMEGGIIKNKSFTEGQYVIKYEDYILGTAVVTKGGIKSRFPRAKRTQEIYFD